MPNGNADIYEQMTGLEAIGPDEVVEPGHGAKLLTITLDFYLGPKKAHNSRLREAYRAAVTGAEGAVTSVLLDDSVVKLRSRMTYGYVHLTGDTIEWDVSEDHDDPPEGDEED